MNLFRSEAHARRWWAFDPATAEGILPLEAWALEPDIFLRGLALRQELFRALKELGKVGPFWGIAERTNAAR